MGIFVNSRAPGHSLDNPEPNSITIGLVNNMPDSALEAAERQFVSVLAAAAGRINLYISFYALSGIPRTEYGQRHVGSYRKLNDLWNRRLDGLIVTGADPRPTNLVDEPCWPGLRQLMDWADHNTYSSIWSCLSAHAATLHLDGIHRRLLDTKRFGVFDCYPVENDPLTVGIPARLRIPHSRWHEISRESLASNGYRILTRSADGSVDMCVKQRKSLFVFFQGHPEYETDTLLWEYRRDIRRFLKGEKVTYPTMPEGYLTEETVIQLRALQQRAAANPSEKHFANFPQATMIDTESWRPHAVQIYRNWLAYIISRKARMGKSGRFLQALRP